MFLLHKMLNQVDVDRRSKMMSEAPDEIMLEQRRQDILSCLILYGRTYWQDHHLSVA